MNEHLFFTRRQFLGSAMAAGASATFSAVAADDAKPKEFCRVRSNSGPHRLRRARLVGSATCFKQRIAAYEICAVADSSPNGRGRAARRFGVDKAKRFSGLSAHKAPARKRLSRPVTVRVRPHFHSRPRLRGSRGGATFSGRNLPPLDRAGVRSRCKPPAKLRTTEEALLHLVGLPDVDRPGEHRGRQTPSTKAPRQNWGTLTASAFISSVGRAAD